MDLKQAQKIVESELKKIVPKTRLLQPNGRTGVPYLSVARGGRIARIALPSSQFSATRTGRMF
jgi:hypothetical protein